jgi:hypothetical protein
LQVAENNLAVLVLEVLIEPQARTNLCQDGSERSLAHLQRIARESNRAGVWRGRLRTLSGRREDTPRDS